MVSIQHSNCLLTPHQTQGANCLLTPHQTQGAALGGLDSALAGWYRNNHINRLFLLVSKLSSFLPSTGHHSEQHMLRLLVLTHCVKMLAPSTWAASCKTMHQTTVQ